ncbi:4-(cytidine 5'-diphospho)-2-C-methyl-D-erythritol kinase [Actinotalea fermentans]|uniref:4-diphosphocytidyl-2-C-methyl-D-erythritol kinase n=1 Tax=Actinotalea fermentans TaxID=43671 RepID=A0A511YX71_9CELL|nr:4-(cytidine 5'-diphospho)-2-C-methyl-D-erythritol kinase [Actinotalea fermentans]GEN79736.1 4-diphosphocytidyl-2-C-methyl-D-erythritol kinase [Actinotalea fermentans]
MSIRVRAPGKVNLSLAVGRRQEDGFHPLATVFQAVSLVEELVATPADDVTVEVTGPQAGLVPTDGSNLAVRAARLLADATGVEAGVHLAIRKDVPVAGGMAGGSADAAAALVACDALWGTGLPRSELARLAADLGSDVPFALQGGTAVGTGRGHLLSPVLSRGEYHWTVGLSPRGLSTPEVFGAFDALVGAAVDPDPVVDDALLRALLAGDAEAVGAALSNDLQHAALELAPELAETLAVAEDAGALGVVVSGSGPTVVALAASPGHAVAIGRALLDAHVVAGVRQAVGPVPGARLVAERG